MKNTERTMQILDTIAHVAEEYQWTPDEVAVAFAYGAGAIAREQSRDEEIHRTLNALGVLMHHAAHQGRDKGEVLQ